MNNDRSHSSIPVTTQRVATSQIAHQIIRDRSVVERLISHPSSAMGIFLLIVIALSSAVVPFLYGPDPFEQNLSNSLALPSSDNLLGTDQLGRDVLARILHGTRYSMGLGFGAVLIGIVVGLPLGVISGFFGGKADILIQRVTDAMLSLPNILLALALIAGLGVGVQNVIIAVGMGSVPSFIRIARGATLTLRESDYVHAAVVLGVSRPLIIWRHIVPHLASPMIVQATVQLGATILTAAGLGFLGLGVQSPIPEWGTMLAEGRNYIFSNPILTTIPGLAICLTVLAFNMVGDGLRDVLDPKRSKE